MQFLSDHVQEMKRSQEVRRPAGLPWHPAPGYLEPVTSGRVCPPGPSAASQDPGFVGNSVISLVSDSLAGSIPHSLPDSDHTCGPCVSFVVRAEKQIKPALCCHGDRSDACGGRARGLGGCPAAPQHSRCSGETTHAD